jgi:hypothetical protein
LVPYGCADTVPRPLDQGQIGLLGHGHRLTADGKGAQITEKVEVRQFEEILAASGDAGDF